MLVEILSILNTEDPNHPFDLNDLDDIHGWSLELSLEMGQQEES
jgi:hypothetical protein